MYLDYAILLLRLMVGVFVAGHGAQKLFGWFGGNGIKGTTKMIESLNIHPAMPWAYANGIAEFGGGLLTALGLLQPLGPVLIIGDLLVAVATVHWSKGFWNSKGGYETPVALIGDALVVGLVGAGTYSLDAYMRFSLPEPSALVAGIVLALIGFGLAMGSGRAIHYAPRRHRA